MLRKPFQGTKKFLLKQIPKNGDNFLLGSTLNISVIKHIVTAVHVASMWRTFKVYNRACHYSQTFNSNITQFHFYFTHHCDDVFEKETIVSNNCKGKMNKMTHRDIKFSASTC